MGRSLPPRVIHAGPLKATLPRTGDDIDGSFRMNNLIVQGRDRMYWRVYSGEGDLDENLDLVALTGTLALTEDSQTIIGTGTLFKSEAKLGQRIVVINPALASWLIIPKQVISDTEMTIWKAPDTTIGGLTGYRMPRLWAMNQQRGTGLSGNAYQTDKGSIFSAGTGVLRIDGEILQGSSLTMTTQPQLSLYDPTTGNFSNFTLGMDTPTGITAAAVGGGTKDMQAGNYSLVVQAARKETGGYNLPSARVDVTLAAGDLVRLTLPAMDIANGQNAWRISVTQFAESLGASKDYLNGPWFFYQPQDQLNVNVTCTDSEVSPAGGTFDLEWLDAEIERNDIVDFVNPDNPPVEAEFVEVLNNIPVYVSCQGQGWDTHPEATSPGPFIVPAKPNNVEAAPLTLAFSSSPPETIIGSLSAQGRIYLLTTNHLQIAQSTPDVTVPILIRPFWKDGFAAVEQLVFVNGNLYGFPVAGPSRSVGDGDEIEAERDWAADVYEITRNWNPGQVLVGFDPFNNMVCFFHSADHLNDAGYWTTRVLGFGVSQNFWIFDRLITDDSQDMIVSGVATIGDRLEILVGGRGAEAPAPFANTGDGEFALSALGWAATGTVTP